MQYHINPRRKKDLDALLATIPLNEYNSFHEFIRAMSNHVQKHIFIKGKLAARILPPLEYGIYIAGTNGSTYINPFRVGRKDKQTNKWRATKTLPYAFIHEAHKSLGLKSPYENQNDTLNTTAHVVLYPLAEKLRTMRPPIKGTDVIIQTLDDYFGALGAPLPAITIKRNPRDESNSTIIINVPGGSPSVLFSYKDGEWISVNDIHSQLIETYAHLFNQMK